MPRCTFQACEGEAKWQNDDPYNPGQKKYACQYHKDEFLSAAHIPGIDPPPNASEFWRPSLFDCIRLASAELNRQDAARRERPISIHLRDDDRGYTPAQLRQVLVLRAALRQ